MTESLIELPASLSSCWGSQKKPSWSRPAGSNRCVVEPGHRNRRTPSQDRQRWCSRFVLDRADDLIDALPAAGLPTFYVIDKLAFTKRYYAGW